MRGISPPFVKGMLGGIEKEIDWGAFAITSVWVMGLAAAQKEFPDWVAVIFTEPAELIVSVLPEIEAMLVAEEEKLTGNPALEVAESAIGAAP